MKRGDIWWVDFEPAQGSEIRKQRPAVIVSNDAANRHLTRVQVVPLTRNAERFYPSDAPVTLDGRRCRAMTDQIKTVAKSRLLRRAGRIAPSELDGLDLALRIQLGLGRPDRGR